MNIPPVGRERDKLIAELKGHVIDPKHNYDNIYYDCFPHYSTSLDCWELWKELPFPKIYHCFAKDRHCIEYQIGFTWYSVEKETFFDAVSTIWIGWKDRQNER